jgi:hypothetical protein
MGMAGDRFKSAMLKDANLSLSPCLIHGGTFQNGSVFLIDRQQ